MGSSNLFVKNNPAAAYAEKRLSSKRDDRCDKQKEWDDAKLRGQMGTQAANRLISMIDDYKSRR